MKYVKKPYIKRGKLYLGSEKTQRVGFLPFILKTVLPLATSLLLGKGRKRRRGRRRRRRLRY